MTDREALADRLEALSASLGHILQEAEYVVCVSGYHPDDRDRAHAVYKKLNGRADLIHEVESILAALREPGFAALASDASVIDKYADLQAVLDDAHKRGAEAMREAAAEYCNSCSIAAQAMGNAPLAASLRSTADMIRLAPLPEPKP